MTTSDQLYRQLMTAHEEALRVGDSPLRADQLVAKLPALVRAADQAGLDESTLRRIREEIGTAERVLRRDDDGREAARHLYAATTVLTLPPRKTSPFLDD